MNKENGEKMNKENKEIEEFIKMYSAIKAIIIDINEKMKNIIPPEIEAETKKLRFRNGIQYRIFNPYGPDEWISVEDIINDAEIAPYKQYKMLIDIVNEIPALWLTCLERVKENNKKLAKLYTVLNNLKNNTFS